jgi:hypothetical protein
MQVKIWVDDPNEIVMLAQFQNVINEYRDKKFGHPIGTASGFVPAPAAGPECCTNPPNVDITKSPEGSTPTPAQEQKIEAAASSVKIVYHSPAVDISDIAIARAITTYGQTHGVPAAQLILSEFGVTKATAITDENRAAFLARVAAGNVS